MATLDLTSLEKAFQDRQDIIEAIKAAAQAPEWIELFNVIDGYVCQLRDGKRERVEDEHTEGSSSSKKRKVDGSNPSTADITNGRPSPTTKSLHETAQSSTEIDTKSLIQIKDISFLSPQRKKYTIQFTPSHILALNPTTSAPIPGLSYAYTSLTHAFCVPIPEKSAKQYAYILFPKHSNLPPNKPSSPPPEPLIFTIPATPLKPGALSGSEAATAASYSDTHKDLFDWLFTTYLPKTAAVQEPDPSQFTSALKESHRPNEPALFCKAFRGSKDGYLFFLSTGLLFLFKKPVLFIPKERILAISYVAVLRLTFNLSIEVSVEGEGEDGEKEEEIEFSMVDQEDFEGVDRYIKRHGLADKSMGESRRAKRLGINDVKGEGGVKEEVEEKGELEKAEEELQDAEDEEEEDYDPGSEGESEGSGSDTDDYRSDAGGDDGEEGDAVESGDEEGEGGGEDDEI